MKRLFAAFVVCLMAMQIFVLSYAMDDKECKSCGKMDSKGSMEKMQAKHIDKMTKDLNLTPDQKEKIAAIMKEAGEKRKVQMDKVREDAKAEMEATNKKITDILTPEQAQKFEKMRAERKEKMDKKMKKMHHEQEEGN